MTTESSTAVIESFDADELSALVKPWDLVLHQASPGRFHALLECVQVNGILVYREHLARRQLCTGATPADYFTFGGPLSVRNPVEWCGDEATPQRLCYAHPDSEVDFVLPEGSDHVALLVPTDLMRSYFGDDAIDGVMAANRHHLASNTLRHSNLLGTLARIVGKYLDHPELLADVHESAAIESLIMDTVAGVFPYTDTNVHFATPTRRHKAFLRAIDICEDLGKPIAVPELAAATHVSPRTLRLAFQEYLGIPPCRYLLGRRMQKVHNELHSTEAEFASVTESAVRWGFSELGRFAVQYKQLFGESPSQTLKRAAPSAPHGIRNLLAPVAR